MKLVFCMADPEYSEQANVRIPPPPRYLRPWKASSILHEIVQQFTLQKSFKELYFVANIRHRHFKLHLEVLLAQFNIPKQNLFFIEKSKGQADSAFQACQKILEMNSDGPIFFHNADTILVGRDFDEIKNTLLTCDGYIDTFNAYSSEYSYALCDDHGHIKEIAEKSIISNQATSGLYGFTSVKQFMTLFNETKFLNKYFISYIYETLLAQGKTVKTLAPHSTYKTIVLDSQEEYQTNSLLLDTLY